MSSSARPADLAPLFHHRWAVPVLGELARLGGGAKFVTLQHHLELGRESLKRILRALIDARLVRGNPGYGHPMRPEYLATRRGSRLGPVCEALRARLERHGSPEQTLRKWPLPVLLAMHLSDGRFNQIRALLPGITPRALTGALRDLLELGLASRVVEDRYPPLTTYRLTRAGRALVPPLTRLARLLSGGSRAEG